MKTERLGEYSFLLGVLVAVVAGFVIPNNPLVSLALIVLGALVGMLNIVRRESTPFLVASIALLLAGSAGFEALSLLGIHIEDAALIDMLYSMLLYLKVFLAPAAVVVALKVVYELGRKK